MEHLSNKKKIFKESYIASLVMKKTIDLTLMVLKSPPFKDIDHSVLKKQVKKS